MKILIMGLPGSGKTTLAASLKKYLEENSSVQTMPTRRMTQMETAPTQYQSKVDWFNADDVRKKFNDWEYVFEKLHKEGFNFRQRITIDNLFQIINTKKNARASYFKRLINAFVTNRNTNDKEIAILERFIEQCNKNNPNDPIKPVDFNDLRMKNIIKRRPSVKDSLIAIGVSFLANITNKFKLK